MSSSPTATDPSFAGAGLGAAPSARRRPADGRIEVVAGPMFSGKTEALIQRLAAARRARREVLVFKPAIDRRYAAGAIVTHAGRSMAAVPIEGAQEILSSVRPTTHVVGVDEAQFFDDDLVEVVEGLAGDGVEVVVAGLDRDFTGAPFAPVPALLAVAEVVTKTRAACAVCCAPAYRTQRKSGAHGRLLVGGHEAYEARCRACHRPPAGRRGPPASDAGL